MLNKYKITNITTSGVVIEDIGVFLPGKGNYSIVDTDLLERSKDFREVENLVRVEKIRVPEPMPVWPFHKPPTPKKEERKVSQEELGGIRQDLKAIRELLAELLSRPSAPSPEVVAAHMQIAQERRELLGSKKLPLSKDPMYIPSSIIPEDAESVIRADETEVTKDDFESNLEALREIFKK
jgi:hypothetical protein